ncbi:hypothetical protein SAMN04488515_1552 [Cognatiyoonia koreensis]|uniref:Uncharacterized protein n=1 Tax=Cognatiyoonia koreensis TaxID=364200 RepID=A0A1I0PZP0_9RHOB|nr:hypothetical protein [Cognatiyoonia koreensis]SEW19950.1 hypothetical protein SAMN04488515_1552 [Cognatiyoonia koreensis]
MGQQALEIAFHIGANCTDDDRLLKSLLKNTQTLADHGVKVPGPGKYRRLIRETIQNLKGAPPAPDTSNILLDAILDDENSRRLVMSNANFICIANRIFENGIFYEQTESKVGALTKLFPDAQIDLYLGIRNPATFIPDAFQKSKATSLTEFLHGFHPTQVRWSDMIRRVRYAAPDCRLTVWCNEDTPLIWAELIRTMSGLAPSAKITGGYDLLTAIMSPEGMNRFLNYMRAHPPKTEVQKRKIITAFLDKYAIEDAIEEDIDLPGMTGELVFEMSEIYDQDVNFISQMEDVHFITP